MGDATKFNSLNSPRKDTFSTENRGTHNQNSSTIGKLFAFPGQTEIDFLLTEIDSTPTIGISGTQKSDLVVSKDSGHNLTGAPNLCSPMRAIVPTQHQSSRIKRDVTAGPKANSPLLEQIIHAE